MMEAKLLFREDQRFREPWLWIMLVMITSVVSGTTLWMMSRQLVHGLPFSDAMTNQKMAVLGSVLVGGNVIILLFFALAALQVEVTSSGLYLRFKPLHWRVRKIDLDSATVIMPLAYSPLMEYGGWGIRRARRGKAYNVSGSLGVRLEYDNGCHLLIGTHRPRELAVAIAQVSGLPIESRLGEEKETSSAEQSPCDS